MEQREIENPDIEEVNVLYADCFRIGYSAYKFVLDFGQIVSKSGKTRFHSRVIADPEKIKDLMAILRQSVAQYEDKFGRIDLQS